MDYLTHVKLTHAIHRNLLLIATMKPRATGGRGTLGGRNVGKVSKPEEFVRVYDILLQVAAVVVVVVVVVYTLTIHNTACD